MAVATLERVYNNYGVFTSVVKIRKGEAVKMMLQATDLNSVKAIMTHFTLKVMLSIEISSGLDNKFFFILDQGTSMS
jgi:farnesyl-diphosphate farnesyltransferase